MTGQIFSEFLGTWVLDTATCDYEQGEAPWADTHEISLVGDDLVFTLDWTDAEGETHHAALSARADGSRMRFNGGPLADALQVSTPSETTLILSAFRDGVELMTATRSLAGDGATLELVQTVNLPDGSTPTNRSVYVRQDGDKDDLDEL